MDKKWDLYVYGDVNIDIVVPEVNSLPIQGHEEVIPEIGTFVGGGAALFCLGAGKLGLKAVFDGKLGDDCYGELIRKTFLDRRISTEYLETVPGAKTGISISFTNSHDRGFLTMLGTNGDIDISHIDVSRVAKARHIHVTGYSGSRNHSRYLSLLKSIREQTDTSISLDTGWDPQEEWFSGLTELFRYIDVVFMNETECCHYAGESDVEKAADKLSKDAKLLVVKLGSKGSMAIKGKERVFVPSTKITPVDTTGAGDSFNAGFIYGYLSGLDLKTSLLSGNICGGRSATAYGGNTAFPSREELEALIKEYGR